MFVVETHQQSPPGFPQLRISKAHFLHSNLDEYQKHQIQISSVQLVTQMRQNLVVAIELVIISLFSVADSDREAVNFSTNASASAYTD